MQGRFRAGALVALISGVVHAQPDANFVDAAATDADAPQGEPSPDVAGDDSGPAETSAAAGATASIGAGAAVETSVAADSGDWLTRYPAEGGMWELGLFGGALFVSRAHDLHADSYFRRSFHLPTGVVGGRLAYFPLPALGVEGEFLHGEGAVARVSSHATFAAYRGHLIVQVPNYSIVPFVLAGGGTLGENSTAMGKDFDPAVHFGGGLKVALGREAALRLEMRENVTREHESGLAFSESVLLGLSATLGRSMPEPPAVIEPEPPPPDSDGDRVPDPEDKCPDVKAYSADGCPTDRDGDGVVDTEDECPTEPGEKPRGCPDLDPDKDGVPVPCDQCPDEAGTRSDGCPVRDADGDGIPDDRDKCPDVAETKNGFEDDDGCPDEIPKEVKAFTGVIEGIEFARAKAVIRPVSRPKLNKAAGVLKKYPSVRVEISGHTSSEGDPEFNDRLSQERADAVRDFLVEAGIDSTRIETRGAGSSEPRANNRTEAGRRKNRRIEFKILEGS